MAERPEAQINLGNLYAARGEADKAVSAYLEASTIDPMYAPAYVNLADLYRSRGDEVAAEKVLRQAVGSIPDTGDLHYALGLSLIRQKRAQAAVEELRLAARLNPDSPRYLYVYAVALNSTGQPGQAIMVLQGAHNSHPNDVDILNALIAFNRVAGNHEQAKRYAQKLRHRSP
jgi:tetratricopeptide (TPR) repeat protein